MPAGVLQQLREDGLLSGWRSESYPVLTAFHSDPLALVERAAAVHLGIKAYGVHVNGFVRASSSIELWVATRSRHKPTWPGKLDHIVAGGQVASSSCSHVSTVRHTMPARCIFSAGTSRTCPGFTHAC
jgi:hypothetical protein